MSDNQESVDQSDLILGYWNIRGNAQPIRLLLAYTKTKYQDKLYNFGHKLDVNRSDWIHEKYQLGLDFPNLPYLMDGSLKLTQSLTILRYLARKHNLAGHNEPERVKIDLIEQQLREYRNRFINATLDKNFEKCRIQYLEQLPAVLQSLSEFLADHPYFAGNSLSYVDFMAYEFIDQHYYLSHELFENLPNLVSFLRRIEEFPTIHEYQYSEKYIRWPSGLLIPWYQSKFYSTFNRSVSDKLTERQLKNFANFKNLFAN